MEETLNIEDIMAEIRQEIKDKGFTSDMLSFEDISYPKVDTLNLNISMQSDEISNSLVYMNTHYQIQPYKSIYGNPVKTFIKKVLRKSIKFYIEPIVLEQNEFNAHTIRVLNSIRETFLEQDNKNNEVENILERIEIIEIQQKYLIKQMEDLKQKIESAYN